MRPVIRAAAVAVGLTAGPGAAQPPGGPALPPRFSPYLNLARQGSGPALNYYGLVRPQTQTATAVQSLQSQANQFNPFAPAAAGGDQAVVTGNPYGFQNYRNYFQNQFLSGGFATGTPAAAGRPAGGGPGGQPFGVARPAPRR